MYNFISNNLLFILLFLLTLIFIIVHFQNKTIEFKKEGFKEGIDWPHVPSPDEIRDKMNNDFNKIKDGAEKVGKDIEGAARKVGDEMTHGFDEVTKGFSSLGEIITKPFKDLQTRFEKIGGGLKNIFIGIEDEFNGLGDGLRLGFTDIGLLIEYTGEFVLTYCFCGVKFITNLSSCIFYYFIDACLQAFYLPIRISLYIIKLFIYKNIYFWEDKFWLSVRRIDNKLFTYIGFYLTKWPRNIRDLCYNCKRLKVKVLKNKAEDVNNDFNHKMSVLLQKGIDKMQYGANEFKSAFDKDPNSNYKSFEQIMSEKNKNQ